MFGTASTTTPAFSFGSTAAVAPTSTSIFGTNTTTTTGTMSTSLFGSSTPFAPSSSSSGVGLFGAPTTTTTAGTSGGFGLFGGGTAGQQQQLMFGNTAQQQQQPKSFFGTTGGLFGSTAPATSTSSFTFGPPAKMTSAPSGAFGQQQQQQSSTDMTSAQALILTQNWEMLGRSVSAPELFGDERDAIIAKLNQLQAICAVGKGYVCAGSNPVDYTIDGPFYRFKTVGYNRKQTQRDSDGLVALQMTRTIDVNNAQQRQQLLDALFTILGNRPMLHAHIDSVKPMPDNTCEVVIYAIETNPTTGGRRRIVASELCAYLEQPHLKQHLTQIAIAKVIARVRPDAQQLNAYLDTPPTGYDAIIWRQAKLDNPDSDELIPVPIRGFDQLRQRQKTQLHEGDLQHKYITELNNRINSFDAAASSLDTRCIQLKANQNRLSHRLLRILAVQLMQHRIGFALDEREECLQRRLDTMNAQLNAPGQLKSRLNELLAIVRCQPDLLMNGNKSTAMIDQKQTNQQQGDDDRKAMHNYEIERYLSRCQEALEVLVRTVESDQQDLQTIANLVLRSTAAD